jgi:hypothetical protein
MKFGGVSVLSAVALLANICHAADEKPLRPRLVGEPWQVAGDPDLGDLTGVKQQPVDFALWQAGDGSWQLWSCIRGTKEVGNTRLFHRWQGARLTDANWQPMGVAMRADHGVGEVPGGLQAPFVFRDGQKWEMFYGGWDGIFAASSSDGKTLTRRAKPDGTHVLFEAKGENPRDPMLLKIGDRWHCYYTAHPGNQGAVYCRTSAELTAWSEARIVARGGQAGTGPYSCECPFVVEVTPGRFYLFRTQRYGTDAQTSVYVSGDPLDFGIDHDAGHFVCTLPIAAPEIIRDAGKDYVAYLLPSLKGVQISQFEWVEAK